MVGGRERDSFIRNCSITGVLQRARGRAGERERGRGGRERGGKMEREERWRRRGRVEDERREGGKKEEDR
jgi:hypothetical protein